MSRNTLLLAAFVFMLASCNSNDAKDEPSSSTAAVTDTTTPQREKPDSATVANAWQDFMTPGPMHKWMKSVCGKWTGESTTYRNGKPGPSEEMSAETRMIMGGLYQEAIYSGVMSGMPFEGKGILAYDNARKKFVNVWIDNSSTGVIVFEGDMDPQSRTMTLVGKMSDPVTGGQNDFRQVVKFLDDSNQVMELYSSTFGKDEKVMEIKMRKI